MNYGNPSSTNPTGGASDPSVDDSSQSGYGGQPYQDDPNPNSQSRSSQYQDNPNPSTAQSGSYTGYPESHQGGGYGGSDMNPAGGYSGSGYQGGNPRQGMFPGDSSTGTGGGGQYQGGNPRQGMFPGDSSTLGGGGQYQGGNPRQAMYPGDQRGGGGGGDPLDKGVRFMEQKMGQPQSNSATEKISDGIRKGYEKLTGRNVPVKDQDSS